MAEHRQLIQDLCDLEIPNTIKISPDGKSVLYSTALSFGHQKGEHAISTLWLASVGQASSSRRLTSGEFKDFAPCWHPDGKSIAFISDRASPGKKWAIYAMSLQGSVLASALTPETNEKPISSFSISPDGTYIAYIAAEEATPEQKRKQDSGEDMKVWGEDWEYHRLHILNLQNREIRILHLQRHILSFCWDSTGSHIALVTASTPEHESQFKDGTTIITVDVGLKDVQTIIEMPRHINSVAWPSDDKIYYCTDDPVDRMYCSRAVYVTDPKSEPSEYRKVGFGVEDEATSVMDVDGTIVVNVEARLHSQLCFLDGTILYSVKQRLEAFDVVRSPEASNRFIVAISTSNINQPCEVYTTSSDAEGMVQLSNHGESLKHQSFGQCEFLTFPSADGEVDLDALYLTPEHHVSNHASLHRQPIPTIVLIHGGPDSRITNAFDTYYYMWAPYLLSRGYGVLLPNHRGGSGRGRTFGAFSIDGGGVHDYNDIIAATDYAVQCGYADRDRLMVGGYSDGGYLSFLCSVRNGLHDLGWRFQAAVPAAGVSDSDSMALSSFLGSVYPPERQEGRVMWNMMHDDTRNRVKSALWEFKTAVEEGKRRGHEVIPPMLILHGEEDQDCHVSQSEGMRRALHSQGLPYEYVVYPRQGHIMHEQKFWVDMAVRIGRWCDTYIGRSDK